MVGDGEFEETAPPEGVGLVVRLAVLESLHPVLIQRLLSAGTDKHTYNMYIVEQKMVVWKRNMQ